LIREADKVSGVELLIGVAYVDEVMGQSRPDSRRRLGRADIHAPIDLHGIGGDDLRPAKGAGAGEESFQKLRFPRSGGAKEDQSGRGIRRRFEESCQGLFFQAEFDLVGEHLTGRQGNHFALIILDIRVLQHGKLIRTAGSGGSDFIHITFVLN
jgi:hypothetical protein